MRWAWSFSILFLASCGSKSDLGNAAEPELDSGTPGFVQCGAVSCDIASGNMCYFCQKLEPPRCHTMDLPTVCSDPAFVLCDGVEDCAPDETCSESCQTTGPCAIPSRICRKRS